MADEPITPAATQEGTATTNMEGAGGEASMDMPAGDEWLFMFQLPPGRAALAAMRNTAVLLDYLLSGRPHNHDDARPEVLYAGVVGARILRQAVLTEPDMAKEWDIAVVVRFPPGAGMGPDDLGAGVALAAYRCHVAPLLLPSQAQADACPDTPELLEVVEAGKPMHSAMLELLFKWRGLALESDGSVALPIMPKLPVSGLNLLKYKAGSLGAPCYQRYLRGMYELMHRHGGGLWYYGKVIKDDAKPVDDQWDEIVITHFNSGVAFFRVIEEPTYPGLLALRNASVVDSGNIDMNALEGSLFAIP